VNAGKPHRPFHRGKLVFCRTFLPLSGSHVLLAMQKVEGSNPFSRFAKGCDLQVFLTRQPASASASPCTQCAPARLDVPVGAEKDRICRSFANAQTTDLLHGGQKGQGFESRGPRVARSGDPQCSCRRGAALSTGLLLVLRRSERGMTEDGSVRAKAEVTLALLASGQVAAPFIEIQQHAGDLRQGDRSVALR
jgi:hypothetical protein